MTPKGSQNLSTVVYRNLFTNGSVKLIGPSHFPFSLHYGWWKKHQKSPSLPNVKGREFISYFSAKGSLNPMSPIPPQTAHSTEYGLTHFRAPRSCHRRDCSCTAPEFSDDADVAESHEECGNDEHGHQLVDGYYESYIIIGIPAIISRDAGSVVVVGYWINLLQA
ncbi:hypothetical protein AVEN_14065-1 [Araneus ventricosus]|uniref:Uncharacterized protein n=1 Tax=Araneus ventricosus TaxID=182803 RepID=A0A4Y2J2M5_ARAVE|nr:hypothetical protein AVEN_14065-1 [Araneus ventricosus]